MLCTCIVFALEIFELKSEVASLEKAQSHQQPLESKIENLTEQVSISVSTIYQQLSSSYSTLDEKIENLNSSVYLSHQQISEDYSALDNTTQQVSRETQLIFNALERPGMHSFHPIISCAALPPFVSSGYYWVRNSNGSAVRVYCDMTRSCGGITGGWARVAELDMTNSSHQCPSGFTQQLDFNRRTCKLANSGCFSVTFSSAALQYSSVCGKIKAYQVGSTDAFFHHQLGIDSNYVDGVSLTHGRPRQHIWTFASAHDEVGVLPESNCPCTNTNSESRATSPPVFVGGDYFCDTGSEERIINHHFYGDDPLWDGAGCGSLNTCCSFNNPPWFFKQLSQPTIDDIEMRVCISSQPGENIATETVKIYIR